MTVPRGGAPDSGNGYFADQLSYKEWYEFNRAQRIHLNMFETLIPVVVIAAVAFVQFPAIAFFAFPVLLVGRCCYGPVIMAKMHMAIKGIFLCLCILTPWWVFFGTAVGTVLQ